MKTENQIREQLAQYENEIEKYKEYITFELGNWNTNSKISIISFTEKIEQFTMKADMLKDILKD